MTKMTNTQLLFCANDGFYNVRQFLETKNKRIPCWQNAISIVYWSLDIDTQSGCGRLQARQNNSRRNKSIRDESKRRQNKSRRQVKTSWDEESKQVETTSQNMTRRKVKASLDEKSKQVWTTSQNKLRQSKQVKTKIQ